MYLFYESCAYMYVCVQEECLGPIEVRRGVGFPGTGVIAVDYHVGADSVRGQW